jgi:hypothetical protein
VCAAGIPEVFITDPSTIDASAHAVPSRFSRKSR